MRDYPVFITFKRTEDYIGFKKHIEKRTRLIRKYFTHFDPEVKVIEITAPSEEDQKWLKKEFISFFKRKGLQRRVKIE